jgi:peptidoglycan/xylan/chitin deacetylase (PgdA/CDA1 family)
MGPWWTALAVAVALWAPSFEAADPVTAPSPVAAEPALHLPAHRPGRVLRIPILTYHRIDVLEPGLPAITRRLTVAPRDFAAQMRWLRRNGFHALTQRELFAALEHGAPLPPRPVLITFDDGYRDVLTYAAPVLHRLDMPATMYVITKRLSGRDPSFLTVPMLRRLERHGVEIGSHTVSHPDLTALSDRQLRSELVESRRTLERALRHPVQWLAYPYGAHDARVVEVARRAGYVLAVTTRHGDRQPGLHPLELYRIRVVDTTGLAGLTALLAPLEPVAPARSAKTDSAQHTAARRSPTTPGRAPRFRRSRKAPWGRVRRIRSTGVVAGGEPSTHELGARSIGASTWARAV